MTYRSNVGLRNRHRNKIPIILFFIIVAIIFYIFRSDIAYQFSRLRYVTYAYIRTDASTQIIRDGYVKSLEDENQVLREKIQMISTTTARDFINYPVIATPPFSPYDTVIIDIEESQKPAIGAFAQNIEGFALGKVEAVNDKTATVRLFSSSGFKNQVRIGSGATTTLATVEGMGGGNFYAKLPQNTKVEVGDPVNWLSKRKVYLGVIEYQEKDSGSAFNNIYFKLPVDISKLLYVSIEKNSN